MLDKNGTRKDRNSIIRSAFSFNFLIQKYAPFLFPARGGFGDYKDKRNTAIAV
jgi:hypothetical protein